jgi:DNA-binding LytR/AlgR family response regulator
LKLAICEDNPTHYEMINTLLQKSLQVSFEITHFTSGDEFLRTIEMEGCPYSIVLTDIDLGTERINGISLAEKINCISPDTQIIFISQYLQYATAVYETEHAYFIHKQQMEEYLPKAVKAACRKLEKLHTQYLYFSGNSRNYQVLCSDILYLERNLR